MHKTITAKNTSLVGSSLHFHNLEVASIDRGVLRLQVPADRAAHCRINQFLASRQIPAAIDVTQDGCVTLRRVFEREKVLAKAYLPRWNDAGACAVLSKNLASLNLEEKKAA
jgi:hypothetical protein